MGEKIPVNGFAVQFIELVLHGGRASAESSRTRGQVVCIALVAQGALDDIARILQHPPTQKLGYPKGAREGGLRTLPRVLEDLDAQ